MKVYSLGCKRTCSFVGREGIGLGVRVFVTEERHFIQRWGGRAVDDC